MPAGYKVLGMNHALLSSGAFLGRGTRGAAPSFCIDVDYSLWTRKEFISSRYTPGFILVVTAHSDINCSPGSLLTWCSGASHVGKTLYPPDIHQALYWRWLLTLVINCSLGSLLTRWCSGASHLRSFQVDVADQNIWSARSKSSPTFKTGRHYIQSKKLSASSKTRRCFWSACSTWTGALELPT